MDFSQAVKSFIAINRNHLADKTIDGYKRALYAFSTWLDENEPAVLTDVGLITRDHLRGYIAYLKIRKAKNGGRRYAATLENEQDQARRRRGLLSLYTIHRHVRCLKRFFNVLQIEGLIDGNPGVGVQNVSLPAPAAKNIPTDALLKLLAEAQRPAPLVRFDARDAAIAALMGVGGTERPDLAIGSGELKRLRLGDVDGQRLNLIARPFGHSPEDVHFTVDMTASQAAALANWLDVRPPADSEHVFITLDKRGEGGRGGQMRNKAVYAAYRKHIDMTPEERATRQQAIDQEKKYTARRLALVLFFLDTGARRGGIIGLTRDRLDLANRRAIVLEKNRTVRTVFFSDATAAALADWLAWHDDQDNSVFSITPLRLRQMFDKLAEAAGVDAIHNPHAWRHTFAKLSIMNGADLTMVQRFLGHRSIKITADYYAHFATDELAKLHDQVSPVAGLTGENGA